MTTRPDKGRGLFYHRDSEAHSDLAPPQYVEWARTEAARLGVTFTGTPAVITDMIAGNRSVDGDLYLDYGVSGNVLSRPGFDRFRERAISDRSVSHLFVSKRDRLGRPDNPLDSMFIEYQLRSAGLTLVLMGGTVLPPVAQGERIDLADMLTSLIEYDTSGKFCRDLVEKLIHAKVRLAKGGFSIGGEPLYGFRRWLCAEDGTRKRQLEDHERVKMPGHHVVWLPTATDELAVVRRILDLIETTPAARIARLFNEERIPSPKAGRTRTRNGRTYELSGRWTQNTVRNIATHPLLIALWEYGKRSEGDQLRFTKDGPRRLEQGDYHPDGKLRTVTNPSDQIIRTPVKSDAVISRDRFDRIQELIESRGRHLKGKARTRGTVPNPLGGRVYDLNCGWPMYRYAKRKKWCYGCGLYQNSEAKCCRHNTVPGGDGPVVHPARVGARLDHHRRARVRREQPVDRARGGVQFAERVRPGAAVGNARHALVPTQIDGDNRVTHRKPPTGAGDYPHPNTHGLHGFFRLVKASFKYDDSAISLVRPASNFFRGLSGASTPAV